MHEQTPTFDFLSPQKESPRLFISPNKTNDFFFDEDFKVKGNTFDDNFKFLMEDDNDVIEANGLENELNLFADTTVSEVHYSDNIVSETPSLNLDLTGKGFFIPNIFTIRNFLF